MMAKKRLPCILFLLLVFLASCREERHPEAAFYYWKTVFVQDSASQTVMQQLNSERIFLRMFDLAWDEASQQPRLEGNLRLIEKPDSRFVVTPVVYIENEVLRQGLKPDFLANLILTEVNTLLQNGGILHSKGLQIDCDWTAGTREAYFSLLEALKMNFASGEEISSTIRLHQVRDRDAMGVPPVARGLLMAYNLQSPTNPKATNSILDQALLEGYAKSLPDYPLPLDVGLPLFSWGVVQRNKQFRGLLDNLRERDAMSHPDLEKTAPHTWQATKNTYIQDYPLFRGETVRIESVSETALLKAAQTLAEKLNTPNPKIVFFHLDPELLQYYSTETLENSVHAFK